MDKTHVILDFKSDLRTSGSNNEPRTHYTRNINFEKLEKGKQYFMRLENIELPTSFYQINSNYNTFVVRERNSGDITQNVISMTIPEGNYTIAELVAELESQLNANTAQGNTYTVSYTDKTGKITISYTGGASVNVDILSYVNGGSTINPIIGAAEYNTIDEVVGIQPSGTQLPYAYNLNFISYVNVELNISSQNHLGFYGYMGVGARVPVKEARGDKINISNDNGYKIRVRVNHFSEVRAKIWDPYRKPVDLNGAPFSFQIVVYEKE